MAIAAIKKYGGYARHRSRRRAVARGIVPARQDGAELGAVRAAAPVDPADQRRGRSGAAGAADGQAGAAGARLSPARHRLASQAAHRDDLRLAGDSAAADRLLLRARIPQPRHRQLVRCRGQAGPERGPDAQSRRARSEPARVPRCDGDAGAGPGARAGTRADPASRPRAARRTVRSRSRCSVSTGASSPRAANVRPSRFRSAPRKRPCCRSARDDLTSAWSRSRAAATSFVLLRPSPLPRRATSRGSCWPCSRCRNASARWPTRCSARIPQYGELSYLREPLKYSFRLTLTLVLLLSLLAAVYGAFFSAQRLVKPIQDLAAGTRAVGKGDFDTRLPLSSRDEMGFLVHSFNDMTKRLRTRARGDAPQPAGSGERARESRRDPGALVDGRHFSRTGHEDSQSPIRPRAASWARTSTRRPARRSPSLRAATTCSHSSSQRCRRNSSLATRSGASSWNCAAKAGGAC